MPDGRLARVRQACCALVCCGGGLVVPSACVQLLYIFCLILPLPRLHQPQPDYGEPLLTNPTSLKPGPLLPGCANRNLIMENSVYYVASPEACAAILWKSREKAGTVS